ncbi:hypothetical protein F4806DRAFT_481472 [Annulohypoxylon nitens]|nr:hypothetical protein F4806DRAFT_481472 [Annulohypoxylon nitens]
MTHIGMYCAFLVPLCRAPILVGQCLQAVVHLHSTLYLTLLEVHLQGCVPKPEHYKKLKQIVNERIMGARGAG